MLRLLQRENQVSAWADVPEMSGLDGLT